MMDSLMNEMGRAVVKRGWESICEAMKSRGADLIENPGELVSFLRGLADSIEKRKDYFDGKSRTEQNETAAPQG